MKTIKQILESHNIKEDTLYHNYSYLYESIVKAMEEFGEQSFNAGCEIDDLRSGDIGDVEFTYVDFYEYTNQLNNGQD